MCYRPGARKPDKSVGLLSSCCGYRSSMPSPRCKQGTYFDSCCAIAMRPNATCNFIVACQSLAVAPITIYSIPSSLVTVQLASEHRQKISRSRRRERCLPATPFFFFLSGEPRPSCTLIWYYVVSKLMPGLECGSQGMNESRSWARSCIR